MCKCQERKWLSTICFQSQFDLTDLVCCSWTKCHYGPLDWNIVSPPQPGLNGKECRLPRGRFLGGSSGSNGTICIRGVKQDYDDWGFPEWSGDEMFRAMKKVHT
jgi:choline dehydrogenase-like flavoprotein